MHPTLTCDNTIPVLAARTDPPPAVTATPPKHRPAANSTIRRSTKVAAAVAPPAHRRAPIWDRPVPHTRSRPPLVWLLGAHGGAGVSTLEQLLAPTADCGRRWPAPGNDESPFVLVVCRETVDGLTHAHDLLRQYHTDLAGGCLLVGWVTCAHRPGRPPAPIRRYRKVIEDLVPERGRWRMPWHDDWPLTELAALPTWNPVDPSTRSGKDPLAAVHNFAVDLLSAISEIAADAPKEPQ